MVEGGDDAIAIAPGVLQRPLEENPLVTRAVFDLWAGTVNLNLEIQHILIFCDFLDSNVVPIGISAGECQFYLRTAERMVREGFLPSNILDQFEKSKSARTSPNSEEMKSILSLAA